MDTKEKTLKLSVQAIGAVMLALQNSLMEQTDIVPVFRDWELYVLDDKIYVSNPPIVNTGNAEEDTDTQSMTVEVE